MTGDDMGEHAGVIIRPPIVWLVVLLISWGLHTLVPIGFVPDGWPHRWIGGIVFILAVALAVWAFVQFSSFRQDVDTHTPTTYIETGGPFAWSRNPIYLSMLISLVGLAIAFDTLWIVFGLAGWYPVMRWGVIAREEAYLERNFGKDYLDYKSRVRRWI